METRDVRIILAGCVLLAAAILLWAATLLASPSWAFGLGATILAELVAGRESAIPLALSQGVPPTLIAGVSILQNIGLAAVVVPLVAAGAHRLESMPRGLGRLMARIAATARAQTHRATAVGVFLFMLVPFLANGPIIAGLLGLFAGIERRRLMVAITFAVVLTATAWSFAYAALASALASVDPRLAKLPGLMALAAVAWTGLRLAWSWRQAAPESEPREVGSTPVK